MKCVQAKPNLAEPLIGRLRDVDEASPIVDPLARLSCGNRFFFAIAVKHGLGDLHFVLAAITRSRPEALGVKGVGIDHLTNSSYNGEQRTNAETGRNSDHSGKLLASTLCSFDRCIGIGLLW